MHKLRKQSLLLLAIAAALPGAAMATPECKHSEPRQLAFNTAGVKAVPFDVRQNTLKLVGVAGSAGSLKGRACASAPELLKQLEISQERSGDTLIVHLRNTQDIKFSLFGTGSRYAYLDLAGSVPAGIPVRVDVGSGDLDATGLAALDARVGSGDVAARRIAGAVSATVGSGDVALSDVGSLNLPSLGSGDLKAQNIRGSAVIGSIGSGDVDLRGIGGAVKVGSIGSGDLDIDGARSGVSIGSVGSGDATVRNIVGNVSVASLSSGDIDVAGVKGNLSVGTRGSGNIDHSGVTGSVTVPRR